MKNVIRFLLVLCLAAFTVPALGQTLYGATGNNSASNLYILNPATGAVLSTVGPIGMSVTGLAFHPTTGVLYGVTPDNSPASADSLITINKATGAATVIGPLINSNIADITFTTDGALWGWCECSDDFASINIATGAATIVSNSGIGTRGSGIAADGGNTIYYAGNDANGALRVVDRITGLTAVVSTLNGPANNVVNALAFSNFGVLYASVNLPRFNGGPSNSLATINPATGNMTILGPTVLDLDAIAFSGQSVTVPTLDGKALALFGVLLAAAGLLVLRLFRS